MKITVIVVTDSYIHVYAQNNDHDDSVDTEGQMATMMAMTMARMKTVTTTWRTIM